MRKNFNSVPMLETSEVCDKYSKSVSYETLVIGAATTGRGRKQIQKMFLGSADKPLSAVGTLTSLLCNSAKVMEKLLRHVITRSTLVRRCYLPEQGIHANEEALFASVIWLMRLPHRIQRMLLVMTILALAFLLSLNLSTAFAGTTCNWDGTKLIISGSGTFNGCSGNSQRTATEVTIGIGVTSIGGSAFWNAKSLTSITIPKGVTSIGDYAFWGASSLTSITIPKGVTSIGDRAFWGASSLESITIPEGVTSIGGGAFSGASSLTSITIPDSVTSIGDQAFQNASSLKSITIPEGVTSIGSYTFQDAKSLESITIPDSVTSIGDWAFWNASSLTSITISDSVTSIGKYAFYGASSLASITIPDSVTSIGWDAFGYTGLTNIMCKGDEASCADTVNALRAIGYKGKISYPDNKTSCEGSDISLYVWDDRNRKCRRRNENQCNASGKYYYNGATCLYRPRNGQVVCVNPNYKANDGYCDRLRYTPAEAAKVLTDDNNNSVTITFKK